MTPEEAKKQIIAAWMAAKPIAKDDAMLLANHVLKGNGLMGQQFSAWFDKNGVHVLKAINRG